MTRVKKSSAGGGNVSRELSFLLVGLTAFALLLYAIGIQGWLRSLIALIVFTFVPGAAVLTLLPRLRPIARIALASAISLTLIAAVSYLLLLLHLFYPAIVAAVVFPLSAFVLARSAPPASKAERKRKIGRRILKSWDALLGDRLALGVCGALLIAAGFWFYSINHVDYREIADFGLVPLLGSSWKTCFAIVLVALGVYATSTAPKPWLMATIVGALIAAVYLVPVAVYEVPHYPWNYKHVGVTELLLHNHRALNFVDIYNRWPSFFAAAGVYTRFGGFSSTLDYVKWAEIYFIGLQATLVAAIALTVDKRIAVAGLSAGFFVLLNWIGQAYFSPQAYSFVLMLAVVLIAFGQLYDGGNKIGELLKRVGAFLVRKKQEWPGRSENTDWPQGLAVAVLLAIMFVTAMVHQLTPYVLLMQLTLITLAGFLRPRWLFIAAGALTVSYLVPQFGWINENFGVLGSLDPFANAGRERVIEIACNPACQKVNLMIILTTLGGALGGVAAIFFLGRRRPDLPIGLLALSFIAPFLTLVVQSYGGEAILRVVMFSAAFSGILIALALSEVGRGWLRRVLVVGALLVLGLGFTYSYFGKEEDRYLTPEGVESARYVYRHAPLGSVLVPLAPNAPGQLTYNYWTVFSPFEGIFVDPPLLKREYNPGMTQELANWIANQSESGFVIFSPQMVEYAEDFGLMPKGTPEKLRKAMLKSPLWELWHKNGDVEVFKLNAKAWREAAGN